MKSLKELHGVKLLSKTEQKSVKGGAQYCDFDTHCKPGFYCYLAHGDSGWCIRGISPE